MVDDLKRHDAAARDVISIMICQESGSDSNIIEQLRNGAEEEEMPTHVIQGTGTSTELSKQAAEHSQLGVGIGLARDGTITLNHFQMPEGTYIIQVASHQSPKIARIMGSNAARLYKGFPFLNWELGG